jgi:hypothetical protein
MELRLVNKKENRELDFPFANECKRDIGTGRVRLYDNCDPVIMQGERCIMAVKGAEKKPSEGDIFAYLLLTDDKVGRCAEYCWSSEEWTAYLVNDSGKSIGRINS